MYKDLVEQESTTAGTGAYTVSGTVAGRVSFATAFVDGDTDIPYVVTDDAGNYECGLGTWDETAGTLARTTVLSSSNAGAAVDWAAGSRRIYVAPHALLMRMAAQRHETAAANQPTATDDIGDGYRKGSLWYWDSSSDFNKTLYYCANPALGAAVWSHVPTLNRLVDNVPRYYLQGALLDRSCNFNLGATGHTFWNGESSAGAAFAIGDSAVTGMFAFTADATPKKMAYTGDHATYASIYCEGASCVTLIGSVSVVDEATGDVKSWKIEAVAKTTALGTTTIAAGGTPVELYEDAGLTGVTIAVVGGTNDAAIEVTGAAAKDLVWSATLTVASAATY